MVQLRARPRNDFPGRHTQAPGPGLPLTVAPLHYAVLPTPTLLPLPRLGSPRAKPAPRARPQRPTRKCLPLSLRPARRTGGNGERV